MLRGVIIEDALPSAARLSNSSRGLPAKDIIEYVTPEIQLSCLKQSLNDEKSKDQLLALDEQGVSWPNAPVYSTLDGGWYIIVTTRIHCC